MTAKLSAREANSSSIGWTGWKRMQTFGCPTRRQFIDAVIFVHSAAYCATRIYARAPFTVALPLLLPVAKFCPRSAVLHATVTVHSFEANSWPGGRGTSRCCTRSPTTSKLYVFMRGRVLQAAHLRDRLRPFRMLATRSRASASFKGVRTLYWEARPYWKLGSFFEAT